MVAPLSEARPREGHAVQFYESEEYLLSVVTGFLVEGLAGGESALVIATAPHLEALRRALASRGLNPDEAERAGRLYTAEAPVVLERICECDRPVRSRFRAEVEPLLARARAAGRGVRAYGEMVDLAVRRGKPAAALQLEELWNELALSEPMALLCAYDLSQFAAGDLAGPFLEVCRAHACVRPAEGLAGEMPEPERREVALLQQRARALEREVVLRCEAEEALREAVRVRDEFLSSAAHELRTPLTVLQLQLQSLALTAGGESPRMRDRLEKALRQVGRLTGLVEGLVEAGAPPPRRKDLALESFDLAGALTDALERARAEGGTPSAVTLQVEGPLLGRWDRPRLERALLGLLSNALKFGGGQAVEVRAHRAGDRAVVVVRDHGAGIRPEDQARIFERFERAVSPLHFGGLGLGLWVAKQVVEAHGGSLWVESQVGQGATFTLDLPLMPPPA